MKNEFGQNLKKIRTDKNMTQGELAEAIHVKQVTISSWETGRTEPSMGDISNLAEVLGCTQDTLMGIRKKTGDITFEDILIKVNALSLPELERLKFVVDSQLHFLTEIENLEKQKHAAELRAIEYANRISELRKDMNDKK